MTLYEPGTDKPVAILSYWHVTDSPHGVGNALVLWLDAQVESGSVSSGVFTDNVALANVLNDTLTRHFPEFESVPVDSLPCHEAQCEHVYDGDGRYVASCRFGENRIVVEWADVLDRRAISWKGFPAGERSFDLQNVICPCGSGTLTINGTAINATVQTATRADGSRASSAFLAFAESWVGPLSSTE